MAPDQRSVQFIKYSNREQPPLIYSSIRKTSIKIKPATFALQDISDEMFKFSEMSKDDKATPEHLAAKLEDIEDMLKNNAGCLDLQNEGSDCVRNLINTVQGELLQKALVELLDRYSSSKRQRLE